MDKELCVSLVKHKVGSYTDKYFVLFANNMQIACFGYEELVKLRRSIDKVEEEIIKEFLYKKENKQ